MQKYLLSFLFGFIFALFISSPKILDYIISILPISLPPSPRISPEYQPILYFFGTKMATVVGVVRCQEGVELNSKDIKITVKTAHGLQRDLKVFETAIKGIFVFSYSVPIGDIEKISLPPWFGKKIAQRIKIIKLSKEKIKQWSFPHTLKCEVPNNYRVIPMIKKINNSENIVDFVVIKSQTR